LPRRIAPATLAFLAVASAFAGCVGEPEAEARNEECRQPEGEDGAGFVRYGYYVQLTSDVEDSASVLVPVPRDARTGEPAPIVHCLRIESGRATWRLEETDQGPFLRVEAPTGSAWVRGAFLFPTFSDETVREHNWSLEPLKRELTFMPPKPSGSTASTFPLGETTFRAEVSGAVVKVYLALDTSRDDREVMHRQDVLETRARAGWQPAVVFRTFQKL